MSSAPVLPEMEREGAPDLRNLRAMGFKMVSYAIGGRMGETLQTASQFIPLSAKFRNGSLFLYGMQSNDPHDQTAPTGRTYQVAVYGDGDALDPTFEKDQFVGTVEIEGKDSGSNQWPHVFCRRTSVGP